MTRGTTPTLVLTLEEDIDLTAAARVYATFRRGGRVFTKTGDDLTLEDNAVSVYLTQEETLMFPADEEIDIQLNWVYADGSRACSEIVRVPIGRQLLPEVLP